jgi:hypothetical protein
MCPGKKNVCQGEFLIPFNYFFCQFAALPYALRRQFMIMILGL